jgi:hypothetical protein
MECHAAKLRKETGNMLPLETDAGLARLFRISRRLSRAGELLKIIVADLADVTFVEQVGDGDPGLERPTGLQLALIFDGEVDDGIAGDALRAGGVSETVADDMDDRRDGELVDALGEACGSRPIGRVGNCSPVIQSDASVAAEAPGSAGRSSTNTRL